MKIPVFFISLAGLALFSLSCQTDRNYQKSKKTYFTHGPMLGRLESQKIGIWARTAKTGSFFVKYGLQPSKLDLRSSVTATQIETDNTAWVQLTGLKSGIRYYYQLIGIDQNREWKGPGGSFRTLPSPDSFFHPKHNPKGRFNFRFEFACGNNQNTGGPGAYGWGLPAYGTMLKDFQRPDKSMSIDFAILNGDWLYEEQRQYKLEDWLKQVNLSENETPDILKVLPNIVGVWENYKLYLNRGKYLNEWHRSVPTFFTFDDHEIVNDVYGTGQIGFRNRRAVFRDIALQAWYHYLGWSNPVKSPYNILYGQGNFKSGSDILTDPKADFSQVDLKQAVTLHVHWGTPDAGVMQGPNDNEGGEPNSRVYRIVEIIDGTRLRIFPPANHDSIASYSIGQVSHFKKSISNADFFFLDTRSHRMMHDVKNPSKKGISMLGIAQKNWLKREMKSSQGDFFFVISSVNFTIPHVGATGPVSAGENKDDAWTVFLEEREELIRFWDSLGKPVFVLTGDLHNSFAIKVTNNVWEFASGPHNSTNHPLSSEGNRPTNGLFNSQGREVEIRWSSFMQPDTPNQLRNRPIYCVVQVNNVFNNPVESDADRWVAYEHPQIIFQYYDGLNADLLYAESIVSP